MNKPNRITYILSCSLSTITITIIYGVLTFAMAFFLLLQLPPGKSGLATEFEWAMGSIVPSLIIMLCVFCIYKTVIQYYNLCKNKILLQWFMIIFSVIFYILTYFYII